MSKYKFTCEKGHTHTLEVPGCRVCPSCEGLGESVMIPDNDNKTTGEIIRNQVMGSDLF